LLAAALVNQESHLVFAGAHLGALLVPIALQSGARRILAFEPAPRNHRMLTLNLALNGLTDVVVHQQAVGDCEGSLRFTHNTLFL
jgi:FkbM family methyltransferase